MPRKPCYWTRKLELELVDFVREKEFIWRPSGNTNHHIQQKYKAYAEFAARLGRGFTARSVRDRWVNIRSTFNHNLRRVDRSRTVAKTPADIYIPCWPLWKPLQFLKDSMRKDTLCYDTYPDFPEIPVEGPNVKDEQQSEIEDLELGIRQRGQRTDRPKKKTKPTNQPRTSSTSKCKGVIDDLLSAIKPLVTDSRKNTSSNYWYFGKHVVEQLGAMRQIDAAAASEEILKLLQMDVHDGQWSLKIEPT